MPFSNEDKALVKNVYQLKQIPFLENSVKIFKDKVQ